MSAELYRKEFIGFDRALMGVRRGAKIEPRAMSSDGVFDFATQPSNESGGSGLSSSGARIWTALT